jgi:pseudouridine kinase
MNVLVIGGANVDVKAKTAARHIPHTSNPGNVQMKPGGVARNIAHNLAKLGTATTLLSIIGQDAFGDMLLHETAKAGVKTQAIIRSTKATGSYVAMLDDTGEMISAVSDMGILELLSPEIINKNKGLFEASGYIIADCNLRPETLAEIAKQATGRLIVEPVSVAKSQKLQSLLESHRVFLATPNLDQIEALTGSRDIATAAKALHTAGLENIVIHAGEQGAFVSDGKSITHIPSQAGVIVDVTGAGDAAMSGLVFGLAQNLPLAKAAVIGQELASKVIASPASTVE